VANNFSTASIVVLSTAIIVGTVEARDSIKEAADTAEVFIYGQQSQNEDLLREISDPKQYEAMKIRRAQDKRKPNENVRVEDVEITNINGDRAMAKATYSMIHGKKTKQTDVYLRRVNDKWIVTTPANARGE